MKTTKQQPRIPCKGHRDYASEHVEYVCDYDSNIDCESCIIKLGPLSPVTGKPFRGNVSLYIKNFKKKHGPLDSKPVMIKLKGTVHNVTRPNTRKTK